MKKNLVNRIWSKILFIRLNHINLIFLIKNIIVSLYYGKKIFACQNTHIDGFAKIETEEKLLIGIYPIRFIDKDLHSYLNVQGKLIIVKQSYLGRGVKLEICPGATVILKGCFIGSSVFRIFHHLEVGNGTLISRNCEFIDDNIHYIEYSQTLNHKSITNTGIIIGSHVWINPGCRILPNVTIADNCVLATGSIVTKSFLETNCLIGGVPAKVIRRNITWKA